VQAEGYVFRKFTRYNTAMPNSQTHLWCASALLSDLKSTPEMEWLGENDAQAAFLLGSISPDVRAVSGHSREGTHFFTIPFSDARPAQAVMLKEYPQLARSNELDHNHAAFVAGYFTHLIMDQTWVEQVVIDALFVEGEAWGIYHRNWRLYALLMAYLEYQSADHLRADISQQIQSASPHHWLPFVQDNYLGLWRDHVSNLIRLGGARALSQMLAQSCRITQDELEAIVLSPAHMADQVFHTVSSEQLAAFQSETTRRCRVAVLEYLTAEF
jgi:hypothetical protein